MHYPETCLIAADVHRRKEQSKPDLAAPDTHQMRRTRLQRHLVLQTCIAFAITVILASGAALI